MTSKFLALIPIFLCSASALASGELKKASFRPQWLPQAQFAGYYVAQAKGFYKEAGIDLEVRPGGPGIVALNNVAGKKDDFATELLLSATAQASKGVPVVNIGQIFQTTGLMLVSKKSSNISTPAAMNGKTLGTWPGLFSIPPAILANKFSVKPKTVTQKFSMDEFVSGKIDIASAMSFNEYFQVLDSGIKPEELNTFYFKDYGFEIPDDGIYAHADMVKSDPELCKNFVKASIKGWLYAFDNTDEAVKIVMDEATKSGVKTTPQHQKRMLEAVKNIVLYRVKREKVGELSPDAFAFVMKALKESHHAQNEVSYSSFHREFWK